MIKVVFYDHPQIPFEGFLFNQDTQVLVQTSEKKIWFYLLEDDKPVGRFTLHITGQKGESPCRAPFGSFELKKEVNFETLDYWIKEVISYAQKINLESLSIVSYPFCYDPRNCNLLTTALTSHNFQISTTDLNFHLDTSNQFIDKLHESEKRRLGKSINEGFTFDILQNKDLPIVHDLVRSCRQRRGFPLSMEKEEFVQMIQQYPSDYIVFGVRDQLKLIAVSVGVKVSYRILYDFLPADDEAYKSFSPMVFLKKGMFDYCKQQGFQMLDLGIATVKGEPNKGLIRFKENLGGIPSLKLSFKLNLAN